MELTRAQLVGLREQALAKRQAHLDMVHQADGAIGILNLLIEQMGKPQAENSDG